MTTEIWRLLSSGIHDVTFSPQWTEMKTCNKSIHILYYEHRLDLSSRKRRTLHRCLLRIFLALSPYTVSSLSHGRLEEYLTPLGRSLAPLLPLHQVVPCTCLVPLASVSEGTDCSLGIIPLVSLHLERSACFPSAR